VERFLYAKHIGLKRRVKRLGVVMAVLLAIVSLRLVQLQIIFGDTYLTLSDGNRFRLLRLDAPRGLILDRNGEVLADNRSAFALSAIPREIENPEATLERLDKLVALEPEGLDKAASLLSTLRHSSTNMAMHVSIKEDIPFYEIARVEEAMTDLPGIVIASRPVRRYVYGDLGGTVLGYLGEVDMAELNRLRDRGYTLGSLIGKTGIEAVCEEYLRGVDGGLYVEVHSVGKPQLETYFREGRREQSWVDSLGRRLRTEKRRDPLPGNDVYLTIDRAIQELCEKALAGAAGAVVVMDADTGELLGLASRPTYDPNIFVGTGNASEVIQVLNDPKHPLLNRAFQATYAPGSVLKPIVAIAAVERGVLDPETRLTCYGSYDLGRIFRCWNKNGHGAISLVDAIAYSCDVFFYQVGELVGHRAIGTYCQMFGLGQPTGLELSGERSGLVPTVEWKRRHFGEGWYKGDTANLSIGQGAILVTPLQMATAYAALVNGGRLLKPHLVDRVVSEEGELVLQRETEVVSVLDVRQETLRIVTAGLRKGVEKSTFPTGTGYRARVKGVDIIGKTGTAQVVTQKRDELEDEELESTPYEFRDHAWFVAAVTDKQPRVVVCVLVEHGGHGGDVAAPIAGNLIRNIYQDEKDAQPEVMATADVDDVGTEG
jgi:penicillin-binding protein 2